MKKIILTAGIILASLGVNAQSIKNFIGEYDVPTMMNAIQKEKAVDTISIKYSDLIASATPVEKAKVEKADQPNSIGMKYSDLVATVPAQKDTKINISETKLVLHEGNSTKEYVFQNIKQDGKGGLVIECKDNHTVTLNKSYDILHANIDGVIFPLKQ